ncbi:hypothetical protein I4F81_005367 [Pyropia yezoensis]|uniref:Uncharacterized protein n=1 Tax=Pyropia yezoensis TaxID=2788 RepID=A0ACC3BXY2_PYRYE|nr:hypothetical protein I4F81_005367 [Neopyropia yezoensis]
MAAAAQRTPPPPPPPSPPPPSLSPPPLPPHTAALAAAVPSAAGHGPLLPAAAATAPAPAAADATTGADAPAPPAAGLAAAAAAAPPPPRPPPATPSRRRPLTVAYMCNAKKQAAFFSDLAAAAPAHGITLVPVGLDATGTTTTATTTAMAAAAAAAAAASAAAAAAAEGGRGGYDATLHKRTDDMALRLRGCAAGPLSPRPSALRAGKAADSDPCPASPAVLLEPPCPPPPPMLLCDAKGEAGDAAVAVGVADAATEAAEAAAAAAAATARVAALTAWVATPTAGVVVDPLPGVWRLLDRFALSAAVDAALRRLPPATRSRFVRLPWASAAAVLGMGAPTVAAAAATASAATGPRASDTCGGYCGDAKRSSSPPHANGGDDDVGGVAATAATASAAATSPPDVVALRQGPLILKRREACGSAPSHEMATAGCVACAAAAVGARFGGPAGAADVAVQRWVARHGRRLWKVYAVGGEALAVQCRASIGAGTLPVGAPQRDRPARGGSCASCGVGWRYYDEADMAAMKRAKPPPAAATANGGGGGGRGGGGGGGGGDGDSSNNGIAVGARTGGGGGGGKEDADDDDNDGDADGGGAGAMRTPLDTPTAATLVAVLCAELRLSLLGVDVVADAASGALSVVDVNYFPGFKGVRGVHDALLRHVRVVVEKAEGEGEGGGW